MTTVTAQTLQERLINVIKPALVTSWMQKNYGI